MPSTHTLVPVSVEAMRRGISRERLIRLIQSGQVSGTHDGGKWYVIENGNDPKGAASEPLRAVPA